MRIRFFLSTLLVVISGIRLISQELNNIGYTSWLFKNVPSQMRLNGNYGSYEDILIIANDGKEYIPDSIGNFVIITDRTHYELKVYLRQGDSREQLLEQKFQLKNHPRPLAYLAPVNKYVEREIDKEVFMNYKGIIIELYNYDIDLQFKLEKFNVLVIRGDLVIVDEIYHTARFSNELLDTFERTLQSGDRIFFTDISAVSDYWDHRELNSISVIIK